jgi:hypothetical protein
VQEGINLSRDEMESLKEIGFVLNKQHLLHLQSLFNEKKSYFSKLIDGCNVVLALNTEWGDCLAHITIYNVKTTLQLVRGWLASCNNFQTTIGSFYSWIWMNLQDFM